MIKSFRNKSIEIFFKNGSKAGIQGNHAAKLARQLIALDEAGQPEDMNIPGWRLHSLTGDMAHHWSIRVSANWRLTFAFENGHAVLVDYKDYH